MSLTSEYFGEISPGSNSKLIATLASSFNDSIEVELVLQDRGQSSAPYIKQADIAMEYFNEFDRRTRELIVKSIEDDTSVPGRIYFAQREIATSRKLSPETFANGLTIESVVITPDGGEAQLDRMVVTYLAETRGVRESFTAIVRESEGLIFTPATVAKNDPYIFG